MEDRQTYEIKDICLGIYEGPHATPKVAKTGGIYLGIPALTSTGHINYDNIRYISDEDMPIWTKRVTPQEGDIVFTNEATLNLYAVIPPHFYCCLGRRLGLIRPNKDLVDVNYLFYYFFSPEWRETISKNKVSGATVERILMTKFPHFPISLPSLSTQQKISKILSTIDAKIENNRKINDNLEQQAQTLYKSWFVDFEPFKDGAFKESEFGLIPEGWRVGSLSELTEITMGQSPSGKSYNETGDGMLFYQGRAEFGDRYPSIRLYTTEPSRIAEQNSVLLSVRAPVGDTNIAYNKCCIGRGLASITAKHGFNSFIFYMIKSLKDQFDLYNGEGTVFGSINRNSLNSMKVIVPTNEVINDFEKIVAPLDFKYKSLFTENLLLTQQRDTLLPKLMSGELKINDLDC